MGWADIHDQLPRQRYAVQLALRLTKYDKTLFFGLVDMALVNAYIVYKELGKTKGKILLSHVQLLKALHLQLVQLTDADIAGASDNLLFASTNTVALIRSRIMLYSKWTSGSTS